jgi:hypothetical protein
MREGSESHSRKFLAVPPPCTGRICPEQPGSSQKLKIILRKCDPLNKCYLPDPETDITKTGYPD